MYQITKLLGHHYAIFKFHLCYASLVWVQNTKSVQRLHLLQKKTLTMVFFQIVIQVPCSSRFPYLKKNFKVKLQKAQNKCIRFCPNLPPRSHRLLSGMLLRKIFYSICKANSNNYHILMIDIIISFSHSNIVFLVIIGILLSRSSYFKF